MGEISRETLLYVLHEWISWCESLIASDGNHFESTTKWSYLFYIIPFTGKDTTLGERHPVYNRNRDDWMTIAEILR
jgi:hypothetical protein